MWMGANRIKMVIEIAICANCNAKVMIDNTTRKFRCSYCGYNEIKQSDLNEVFKL